MKLEFNIGGTGDNVELTLRWRKRGLKVGAAIWWIYIKVQKPSQPATGLQQNENV